MRVREHRGTLAESLATVFKVETKSQLLDEINARSETHFREDDLAITHLGMDERCGWDTYAISLRGYGMFGYCDAMPE